MARGRDHGAMVPQDHIAERVRALLSGEGPVREVAMFGTRSFMVRDKLLLGARRSGALLVRVEAARHDELTARPGAAQATMGPGRDMGPGWVEVEPAALAGDDDLAFWVEVALELNRAAGPRP